MYCSDYLQQKRPNENPLLGRISQWRGPSHPYLRDVKSLFDLFIKPGLNSALSPRGDVFVDYCGGHIVYMF